jgi:hypothetical protein
MLKGWFVLQWSLDNLPLVPDGLWCVIDPNRRTHNPVTETNLIIARAGRAARQRKSVNHSLTPKKRTTTHPRQARVWRLQWRQHRAYGDALQGAEHRAWIRQFRGSGKVWFCTHPTEQSTGRRPCMPCLTASA